MERRDLLRGSLALAGFAPLCCTSPELAAGAYRLDGDRLLVDLRRAPELQQVGSAAALVVAERKLNLLVARVEKGRFVALDRTCTHGGAMCAYNHRRKSLRCTSLNHAEYDLEGKLLHGRTHGDLKSYPARLQGAALEIQVGPA